MQIYGYSQINTKINSLKQCFEDVVIASLISKMWLICFAIFFLSNQSQALADSRKLFGRPEIHWNDLFHGIPWGNVHNLRKALERRNVGQRFVTNHTKNMEIVSNGVGSIVICECPLLVFFSLKNNYSTLLRIKKINRKLIILS
jgi:hypothetical protein